MQNGNEHVLIGAQETTFDQDNVLFDRRSGIFGLGVNRYKLTEHGFLRVTHGRIWQQHQTFDLRNATYEKGGYNFLFGCNNGVVRLEDGNGVRIDWLFYRHFQSDIGEAMKKAQLEHRRVANNPVPISYKPSKAWWVVLLALAVVALALIFVPKLVGALRDRVVAPVQQTVSDADDGIETVSLSEQINNLTLGDVKASLSSVWTGGPLSEATYDRLFPTLETVPSVKRLMLIALYATTLLIVLPRRLRKVLGVLTLATVAGFAVLSVSGSDLVAALETAQLLPLLIPGLYVIGMLGCSDFGYIRSLLAGLLLLALVAGVRFFLMGDALPAVAITLAATLISIAFGRDVRMFTASWAALTALGFTVWLGHQLAERVMVLNEAQIGELRLVGEILPVAAAFVAFIVAVVVARLRAGAR